MTETTKAVPLTCHGHSRPITHISFSSLQPTTSSTDQASYNLISACKDNNPMLRDGPTGDWIGTFIGHKGAVWSSRLSPDASLAATGSADFSARLWDTFTGTCLAELAHNHIVRAVAFPSSGEGRERLATGGMEKRLRIWDVRRVGQSSTTGGSTTNGTHAATGDGTASCYDVAPGVHQGGIKSLVFSRSHPSILTSAADDKKIRWFDLRAPSTSAAVASHDVDGLIGSCELTSAAADDGVALEGMNDGTLSVAAGRSVYFFDAGRPGTLVKKVAMDREVACVAVSAGLRRFVTGHPGDTWVHVWDWDSEQEVETGKGHHGPVWTVSFSPDGKLYATGSEDGTIKLWKATKDPYGLWR